jgi:hypothetical protein
MKKRNVLLGVMLFSFTSLSYAEIAPENFRTGCRSMNGAGISSVAFKQVPGKPSEVLVDLKKKGAGWIRVSFSGEHLPMGAALVNRVRSKNFRVNYECRQTPKGTRVSLYFYKK